MTPSARAASLRTELGHIPAAIAQATGLPDEAAARELIDTLRRLATAMEERTPTTA